MQNLVKGVHYFQNFGFQQQQHLFEQLAVGQSPEALFITCSDSRIDPNLITNSPPGGLFIVRNVGNLIPCYGTSNNGELAAVEYAVAALGVKHIIVCGHTGCGAMRALIEGNTAGSLPAVTQWLRHAESTAAIVTEHYQHLNGDALITAAAQENVLVQLEHLRTCPAIASRISKGNVELHGWMYKIDTGEIFSYDSEVHQFLPLTDKTEGIAGKDANGDRSLMRASA
jgi:carbonic anhydrase